MLNAFKLLLLPPNPTEVLVFEGPLNNPPAVLFWKGLLPPVDALLLKPPPPKPVVLPALNPEDAVLLRRLLLPPPNPVLELKPPPTPVPGLG